MISEAICLSLKFNINELKSDQAIRSSQFEQQLLQLQQIEQAIVVKERIDVQQMIAIRQEAAEQHEIKRQTIIAERKKQEQQQKSFKMKLIQKGILEKN